MANFTESVVEDAALAWLESLGYPISTGRRGKECSNSAYCFEAAGLGYNCWPDREGQLVQKMQQFDSSGICKILQCFRVDDSVRPFAHVGVAVVAKNATGKIPRATVSEKE
jgi:hypothetical protein